MAPRTLSHLLNTLTVLSIIATAVLLFRLHMNVEALVSAEVHRAALLQLGSDLRADTRSLTSNARIAVATGDTAAERAFQHIMNVRQGKAQRPDATLVEPGQRKAFADLLEEQGMTENERRLLTEALRHSDALSAMEHRAMSAARGAPSGAAAAPGTTEVPDLSLAKELLFGVRHQERVDVIMSTLEEFSLSVAQRMDWEVSEIRNSSMLTLTLLCVAFFTALASLAVEAYSARSQSANGVPAVRSYLIIMLVLLISLLLPSWFVYTDAREGLMKALEKRQTLLCRELYRELRLRMHYSTELVQILAGRPPVYAFLEGEAPTWGDASTRDYVLEILQDFAWGFADNSRVLLLDREGSVLLSSQAEGQPRYKTLLSPQNMEKLLGGASVITTVTRNIGPEPVLAVPVREKGAQGGDVVGAVALVMDLHNGSSLWDGRLASEEHMNIFLLSANATVVLSALPGWHSGMDASQTPPGRLVLEGAEGLQVYRDSQGMERVAVFMKLPELGWTVGVSSSQTFMAGMIRSFLTRAILVNIGATLVAVSMISLLLLRLMRGLRRGEDRLRMILEGAGMGAWEYDIRANSFTHNARWAELVGRPPVVGTLPAAWLWEHAHPDDHENLREHVQRLKRSRDIVTCDLRLSMPNGQWRWFTTCGRCMEWGAADEALLASGVLMDAQARKVAELTEVEHKQELENLVAQRTRELEKARNDALAGSAAKTAFLSTVSHEIRTPMNAIVGFTHLFDRSNLTSTQKEYLDKITISAAALLRVINDVLDISKIEAGKLELERVPFRIHAVLDTVCSIMGFAVRDKGLDLTVDVAEHVPEVLLGDPTRVSQILLNLLNNAVKFTSTGGLRLAVTVEDAPGPGREPGQESGQRPGQEVLLAFSVSDTGIGLSQEQISRLFQPFSQADSSVARRYGGTGLGLAICRQLVELMGGSIHVESEEGRGSTFHFTLRLAEAPAGADGMEDMGLNPHASEGQAAALRPLVGACVLVVEDNAINQEIARALLEEFGMAVDMADNGKQGLEMALAKKYALIFMDMQMPVMDGLESTRRIREAGHGENSPAPWLESVPIVAMTANAMSEDRQRCLEAGMNDHLGKPLEPAALQRALLRWIGRAEA